MVCGRRRQYRPADLAARIRWVTENTPDLLALKDAEMVRQALDGLAVTLSGKSAAKGGDCRDGTV